MKNAVAYLVLLVAFVILAFVSASWKGQAEYWRKQYDAAQNPYVELCNGRVAQVFAQMPTDKETLDFCHSANWSLWVQKRSGVTLIAPDYVVKAGQ